MKDKGIYLTLILAFVLVVSGYFFLNEPADEDPNINVKYYDWNARFEIYNNPTGRYEFLNENEFLTVRDRILLEIGEENYNLSSYKILLEGIDSWTTFQEDMGKPRGFSIGITQKGYDDLNNLEIESIMSLQFIYFSQAIDQNAQEKPEKEKDLTYCDLDRECIMISEGCCGCSMGGRATTINRKYYNYFNDKLLEGCQGIGCAAVLSNHISCFSEPKCIDNKCSLIPLDNSTKDM